jgi:hypothetical protein
MIALKIWSPLIPPITLLTLRGSINQSIALIPPITRIPHITLTTQTTKILLTRIT